jgi:hypothetical protein
MNTFLLPGEKVMDLLTVTAILFLITGLLHISTPFRFENNSATRPVAAFGVIYLILGGLLILGVFSWLPVVALILTLIGGIGASTQLNANPELRTSTLLFIGIDIVIVVLLVINLLT